VHPGAIVASDGRQILGLTTTFASVQYSRIIACVDQEVPLGIMCMLGASEHVFLPLNSTCGICFVDTVVVFDPESKSPVRLPLLLAEAGSMEGNVDSYSIETSMVWVLPPVTPIALDMPVCLFDQQSSFRLVAENSSLDSLTPMTWGCDGSAEVQLLSPIACKCPSTGFGQSSVHLDISARWHR